jgi:hypothetical protein
VDRCCDSQKGAPEGITSLPCSPKTADDEGDGQRDDLGRHAKVTFLIAEIARDDRRGHGDLDDSGCDDSGDV